MLFILIALSAALRLSLLNSPPGIHPDEASNIWNAWCLGKTFSDEHAVSFPFFYTRAFNDNRSALFLYVLAPFEMITGLSPAAARLPAALSGVIATVLLFAIVRRLSSDRIALIAAVLWTIDPTHVQFTRIAHEASITPMLVLLSIHLWQKAGLLWTRDIAVSNQRRWASAAGLVAGILCYAYASVRLYLPVFLFVSVCVHAARWKRGDWKMLGIAVIGFLLFFGPLVYVHLTDAAINERARQTWTWSADDAPSRAIFKVAERYIDHFRPGFLFLHGNDNPSIAPPKHFGALPWVWCPLGVIGLIYAMRRRRDTPLAMFTLVALALYPMGDVLNAAGGPNVLRTLSGWFAFALCVACGAEFIGDRLSKRVELSHPIVAAIALLGALPNLIALLFTWGTDAPLQRIRGVDIEQACAFIRPRFDEYDAIVFTATEATYAYPQVLVGLRYSAEKFLTEPSMRAVVHERGGAAPDVLVRAGKLFFLQPVDELKPALDEVEAAGPAGRSLYILRPTDPMPSPTDRLLQTISLSDGRLSLLIVEHLRSPAPAITR